MPAPEVTAAAMKEVFEAKEIEYDEHLLDYFGGMAIDCNDKVTHDRMQTAM